MTPEQYQRLLDFEAQIQINGITFGEYKPSQLPVDAIDDGMRDIINQINGSGWVATDFCCWGHDDEDRRGYNAYLVVIVAKSSMTRLGSCIVQAFMAVNFNAIELVGANPLVNIYKSLMGESEKFFRISLYVDFGISKGSVPFEIELSTRRSFFTNLANAIIISDDNIATDVVMSHLDPIISVENRPVGKHLFQFASTTPNGFGRAIDVMFRNLILQPTYYYCGGGGRQIGDTYPKLFCFQPVFYNGKFKITIMLSNVNDDMFKDEHMTYERDIANFNTYVEKVQSEIVTEISEASSG